MEKIEEANKEFNKALDELQELNPEALYDNIRPEVVIYAKLLELEEQFKELKLGYVRKGGL